MRLMNEVALITGGGTGIGAATARLFASEGAKVVVTGRRSGPIEAVAEEVGGVAVAGDTSDPEHAAEAVAAAISAFDGLDVVVANAGGGFGGAVGDIDEERWRTTLDVNLSGPMLMARAALPAMLERGRGSFVLVSSVNGLAAAPESTAYDVTKAGLIALARAIAVDYGPQGIRANAVCPGWVITPMGDEAMDEVAAARGLSRHEAYDLVTIDVPLRRAATAEEIASCCLFLASDESSIVTGTTLVADGGGMAVELTSTAFGPMSGDSRVTA
jgi:meso-butanediol dehydrogenase / (S,S)-butanediol dehydrogenase / diacetyl reductase